MRRWQLVLLVTWSVITSASPAVAIEPQHFTGLVDSVAGQWHLYAPDGSKITSFYFGNPGDYPFLGDWDCDGVETPGLYRQSDGFVYLRNTNTQGVADVKFFFGNPGDVPLAGDFNGDGCDTVSIYRPTEARFYIINKLGENNGGLGAADFRYLFGDPGDKPFVGDFDGDGIETVGLHRESTGLVYFRNSHTDGIADRQFIFGDPGDRLVAGDWTGDGIYTPALFRPDESTMYFRFSNSAGVADWSFSGGLEAWLPVAGVLTVFPDEVGLSSSVVPGGTAHESVSIPGLSAATATITASGGLDVESGSAGGAIVVDLTAPLDATPGPRVVTIDVEACVIDAGECPGWASHTIRVVIDVEVEDLTSFVASEMYTPNNEMWVETADGVFTVPAELWLLGERRTTRTQVVGLVEATGGSVVGADDVLGLYQVRYPSPGAATTAANTLRASDLIFSAEPYESRSDLFEWEPTDWSDDDPDRKWHLYHIGAREVWNPEYAYRGSRSVHVGLVDTGIFTAHEELRANTVSYSTAAGSDIQNWRASLERNSSAHGTHVAALMCGDQNGVGLVGVMWDCSLHALDLAYALQHRGYTVPELVGKMRGWLVEHPELDIVNLSLATEASDASDEAFLRLFNDTSHDVFFVVAAGNDGADVDGLTPARLGIGAGDGSVAPLLRSNVITVGGVNSRGFTSSFSNTPTRYKAPAGDEFIEPRLIWSATYTCLPLVRSCVSRYGPKAGTSMAAPLWAGMIGLMLSRKQLTHEEIIGCTYLQGSYLPHIMACVDELMGEG